MPLPLLGLGLVLGLHHAFDVDHLVAVLAIVSERRGLWRSSLVGVAWGVGHTTSLFAVALLTIALHAQIPSWASQAFELAVALMLVALGGRLLAAVLRGQTLHAHRHTHAGMVHAHPHFHPSVAPPHEHLPSQRTPFVVGLVHGLAGSAGLMLAFAASMHEPSRAVAFVMAFGLGSIAGMAMTGAAFALPALALAGRFTSVEPWLRGAAALMSVAVGIDVALELGRQIGLPL